MSTRTFARFLQVVYAVAYFLSVMAMFSHGYFFFISLMFIYLFTDAELGANYG